MSHASLDDFITWCANIVQWDQIISTATHNPSILQDNDTIKVVGNIMKTNVAACSSIGSYFYSQIGRIYLDMLSMYRATSSMISDAVRKEGKLPSVTILCLCILRIIRCHCHQNSESSWSAHDQEGDTKAH